VDCYAPERRDQISHRQATNPTRALKEQKSIVSKSNSGDGVVRSVASFHSPRSASQTESECGLTAGLCTRQEHRQRSLWSPDRGSSPWISIQRRRSGDPDGMLSKIKLVRCGPKRSIGSSFSIRASVTQSLSPDRGSSLKSDSVSGSRV
jgi:hypothetical protein